MNTPDGRDQSAEINWPADRCQQLGPKVLAAAASCCHLFLFIFTFKFFFVSLSIHSHRHWRVIKVTRTVRGGPFKLDIVSQLRPLIQNLIKILFLCCARLCVRASAVGLSLLLWPAIRRSYNGAH